MISTSAILCQKLKRLNQFSFKLGMKVPHDGNLYFKDPKNKCERSEVKGHMYKGYVKYKIFDYHGKRRSLAKAVKNLQLEASAIILYGYHGN